jgi:hypothetical protein
VREGEKRRKFLVKEECRRMEIIVDFSTKKNLEWQDYNSTPCLKNISWMDITVQG